MNNIRLSVLLLTLALAASVGWDARGDEELPPCNTLAHPPLIVVLPDGTELPAARIEYPLDGTQRIVVVGYPRVFCDGYEGATP